MTHCPTASMQNRAELGTEMVLPSSEMTSQAPSQASHQVWATCLKPRAAAPAQMGAPDKGKAYECTQGWALCCFICSAVPCTVTALVQENGLGTAPGILASCKYCFGILKYCSMMIGGKQIISKSSSVLALSCPSTTTDLVSAFVLRPPTLSQRQVCLQSNSLSLALPALAIFKGNP